MKITLTKATAALWRLAALHPDRVNPTVKGTCVYTSDDCEHCIVGQVVEDLTGLSVPAGLAGLAVSRDLPDWLETQGVELTETALALLIAVQKQADMGPRPWGRAVILVLEGTS